MNGAKVERPPLSTLLDLREKTAVVTGGGAGIGRAIALRLAEAGAKVVVADFDGQRADAVAREIQEGGGSAESRTIDVRAVGDVAKLSSEILSTFGRLDIWVNNAGIYPLTPIMKITEEDWDRMIEINLRSVFFATREAARSMVAAGRGGVVLNVASIAAYRAGPPSLTHYSASKAGVVALTKNLASAFGGFGIRVVGIAPGVIVTEGLAVNKNDLGKSGANVWNRAERLALRRLGSPDDIARAALFLCSSLADFVTGVTVPVDGGDLVLGPSERPQISELGFDELTERKGFRGTS